MHTAVLLPYHWLEQLLLRHMEILLSLLAAGGWLTGALQLARCYRTDRGGIRHRLSEVPQGLDQCLRINPAEATKFLSLIGIRIALPS